VNCGLTSEQERLNVLTSWPDRHKLVHLRNSRLLAILTWSF